MRKLLILTGLLFLGASLLVPPASFAKDPASALSTGQLIYVPAYAQVYHGSAKQFFHLTVTLSVHNTDPGRTITLEKVEYYSTQGKLISTLLESPVTLPPLATREFVVRERSSQAGTGDNFLVRWRSATPANPPLVESVMIGTAMTQGISFTSRGIPIQE